VDCKWCTLISRVWFLLGVEMIVSRAYTMFAFCAVESRCHYDMTVTLANLWFAGTLVFMHMQSSLNWLPVGFLAGSSWSLKVLEFKYCKIKALKVLENEGVPWKFLWSSGKRLVWSGKFYCIFGRLTSAAVNFWMRVDMTSSVLECLSEYV